MSLNKDSSQNVIRYKRLRIIFNEHLKGSIAGPYPTYCAKTIFYVTKNGASNVFLGLGYNLMLFKSQVKLYF